MKILQKVQNRIPEENPMENAIFGKFFGCPRAPKNAPDHRILYGDGVRDKFIGVTQNGPTIILDRGLSKWAPMHSKPRSSIGVIQKRLPEGSKAILLHQAQLGWILLGRTLPWRIRKQRSSIFYNRNRSPGESQATILDRSLKLSLGSNAGKTSVESRATILDRRSLHMSLRSDIRRAEGHDPR